MRPHETEFTQKRCDDAKSMLGPASPVRLGERGWGGGGWLGANGGGEWPAKLSDGHHVSPWLKRRT